MSDWRNILAVPSIQFWGMFLLALPLKLVCCRNPEEIEVESKLPPLKFYECLIPVITYIAGC